MPRPVKDAQNAVLKRILEDMLDEDAQITARAVVTRHPGFAAASAITRSPERLALLKEYVAQQDRMRIWAQRTQKQSRSHLARVIATKDEQIAKLEGEVSTLVEAHLALISLVAEMGGIRRLRSFYEEQRTLRARLALRNAIPDELLDS